MFHLSLRLTQILRHVRRERRVIHDFKAKEVLPVIRAVMSYLRDLPMRSKQTMPARLAGLALLAASAMALTRDTMRSKDELYRLNSAGPAAHPAVT